MSIINMENYYNIEEDNMAKKLAKNLQREEFKNRDLASIDRIIGIYYAKYNTNAAEEKEVISFLFSYLDEKKEPASILFRHIKNSSERYNIVKRLYNEHRWDFNFDVISGDVFLFAFDFININEKLKKILYFSSIFIILLAFLSITLYFRSNSLKLEFEKQLNEKNILLKNEIASKEKLESDFKIMKQNYDRDIKVKEELGTEIKSLKQNLKDEILTIKEHFESEITNVKEKQKEVNELSTCKENLQQEQLNKIEVESKLITCKENLQQEQLNNTKIESELMTCKENFEKQQLNNTKIESELIACKQINDELLIFKEKYNAINQKQPEKTETKSGNKKERSKPNNKTYLLVFTVLDIIVFTAFLSFYQSYQLRNNGKFKLILSIILEFALNLQFFFNCNSFLFFCFFTCIFVLSYGLLFHIACHTKLVINKTLIVLFVCIISVSSYKYTFIVYKDNYLTKWQILVYVDFILESLAILFISFHNSYTIYLLSTKILLLIYYSNMNYSPFLFSCIAFITFFFLILDDSRHMFGTQYLIGIITCIITLVKFFFFVYLEQGCKLLYIIIIIIEIVLLLLWLKFGTNDDYILALIEICFSLLLINANFFVLIYITLFVTYIAFNTKYLIGNYHPVIILALLSAISILVSIFIAYVKNMS